MPLIGQPIKKKVEEMAEDNLVPSAVENAVPSEQKKDGERLAVNLFDLDRIDPTIRSMLLGDKVDLTAIRVDKDRGDEVAVAFTCDLLSAACICDTLRSHDKRAGDYPTRVYLFKRTAWSRVPGSIMLATVKDGSCTLNRTIFNVEVALAKPVAPPRSRVF